jgi:hypothetical protein
MSHLLIILSWVCRNKSFYSSADNSFWLQIRYNNSGLVIYYACYSNIDWVDEVMRSEYLSLVDAQGILQSMR